MTLEEQLEELLKQKRAEKDKIELRKIRAKIRKVKRDLGTYESPTRQSPIGLDEEEKKDWRRTRKEQLREWQEERDGPKILAFWEAQPKMHGPRCQCSRCAMVYERNLPPPLREWAGILRARGLDIPNGWVRKAYEAFRQGKKPKTENGILLVDLILVSGW